MKECVKKCKGKMCEFKCCNNCDWFQGSRRSVGDEYNARGWCYLSNDDVRGDQYCGDWRE